MALFAVLRTAALFKSRAETKKNQYTNVYWFFLVGAAGFEPTASSSRTRRATNCAMPRKYRNPMGCGLVGDERIELPQVESESTALPLCKSPMTFAWSNKCSQQLFIIAAECVFVNRFFEIFAKAIPHHSKCRCSEREMKAAKQKAQIILCVLSSIFATRIVLRSRGSGA